MVFSKVPLQNKAWHTDCMRDCNSHEMITAFHNENHNGLHSWRGSLKNFKNHWFSTISLCVWSGIAIFLCVLSLLSTRGCRTVHPEYPRTRGVSPRTLQPNESNQLTIKPLRWRRLFPFIWFVRWVLLSRCLQWKINCKKVQTSQMNG